jgi:hypothetical protein
LAWADVLLEVIGKVQVRSVSWQVADEDHFVGVLGLSSFESVGIHCVFLIAVIEMGFVKRSFCVLILINH